MKRHYSRLFFFLAGCMLHLHVIAQSYEEGRSAYINGNYALAYEILKPLAEAGDSESQKMLGIMYDYGHGVKADSELSMMWYKRSAEQGQPAVQWQVGAKYFEGEDVPQDYLEAAKWWELAANGGQVDAQFNLGLMYFRGLGVEQNDALAADLFRKAAEQEHPHAQYSLAVMYAFGRGVEKNYAVARDLFTKSAEKGIAQSQYNLGILYENGFGVTRDMDIAREWYRRAAAQGLDEAIIKLEMIAGQDIPEAKPVMYEAAPEETTVAPALESAYSTSEIATNGIKREDWVMKQSPSTYTIQIGSVVSENDLITFLKENSLHNESAYIQVEIDGTLRYNAFYGAYDTYGEAQQAVQMLPPGVQRASPWIRNFRILQDMIDR